MTPTVFGERCSRLSVPEKLVGSISFRFWMGTGLHSLAGRWVLDALSANDSVPCCSDIKLKHNIKMKFMVIAALVAATSAQICKNLHNE